MRLDFRGKTAVVTGGANGIGLAASKILAAGGACVWIFDLEKEAPEETARSLGARGCAIDVTHRTSIDRALAESGPPDVLVANAGWGAESPLTATSKELWDRTIAINLTGVYDTIQAAAVLMKERRSGSIVLTASTNSYDGEADLSAYNASKAGVLGILHTAANELGPYGIRVNAVCPGLIRTRLTTRWFSDPGVIKRYFQQVPLGRGGEPEEVAAAIAFLASDLASYVTGAALLVDGGQLAGKFGTWNDQIGQFSGDRWALR
jgi:NAD(P)-dependent dehydrogenase (short-subunit alcohol dehydrogenase family)